MNLQEEEGRSKYKEKEIEGEQWMEGLDGMQGDAEGRGPRGDAAGVGGGQGDPSLGPGPAPSKPLLEPLSSDTTTTSLHQ